MKHQNDIQNDISKRHDGVQNDISSKSHTILGLFKNSAKEPFYLSAKKTEKIVAAIYMVTDVMNAGLPLTGALRTESVDLLAAMYDIVTGPQTTPREMLVAVSAQIDHVQSLIKIGSLAQHISPMNADILITELAKVQVVFKDRAGQLMASEQTLGGLIKGTDQPLIPVSVLDEKSFDSFITTFQSKRHQNDIKTTLLNQNDIQNDIASDKTTFKTTNQNDIPQIDRKQRILNAIRAREESTLQDIKQLIKDCSEKTLQREINTLISMGIVRREGNKRWTLYRAV